MWMQKKKEEYDALFISTLSLFVMWKEKKKNKKEKEKRVTMENRAWNTRDMLIEPKNNNNNKIKKTIQNIRFK